MKPRHATAVLLGCLCLPALAQFQTPEAAIKYRQGAFSVMGAHFSRLAMMTQGIQPFDAKSATENAELVGNLARLPFTAFGPGTDKGAPNRSRDEVWKEAAKFKAAAEKMVADVGKLEAAAKGGDFETLKAAVGVVGKSCKSCHDDFRGARRE
ncbi:MAG: cytochrome c [Aquabacterium sp.]|nr:cytochrome c [Aquabacterium sp.]